MKALRFDRFGDISVLHIDELPIPVPGSGEVLVKVHAASINPSDVKNVEGKMEGTTLPRTPGRDFAGIIVDGLKDSSPFLNKQIYVSQNAIYPGLSWFRLEALCSISLKFVGLLGNEYSRLP